MTILLVSEDLAKSHIPGYTKQDGTVVKPHEDKRVKKQPAKWSSGVGTKAPQAGLFGSGSSVPKFKAYHPKLNDKGEKVGLYNPTVPNLAGLADPSAIATITPGCQMPEGLNGIPFAPWVAPEDESMWDYVDGVQDDMPEPPLHCGLGKAPASGLIIQEPDGRVWVVSPSNKFGGYTNTFPKGKQENDELSLQANAVKEAWEEAGIKAEIVSFLGDVERTTSMTRYYLARRVAGNPAADVTWESQAISLVPVSKLKGFLDAKVDHQVVDLLLKQA